jgi:hypothetical protein
MVEHLDIKNKEGGTTNENLSNCVFIVFLFVSLDIAACKKQAMAKGYAFFDLVRADASSHTGKLWRHYHHPHY